MIAQLKALYERIAALEQRLEATTERLLALHHAEAAALEGLQETVDALARRVTGDED